MALASIPVGNTVIKANQYPSLTMVATSTIEGDELVITTPKLGNIVTITCTTYTSSIRTESRITGKSGIGISTTDSIFCEVDEKALCKMLKDHSRVHFPSMDSMPKGMQTVLDCIVSYSEATQTHKARANSVAVTTALLRMLDVLDELCANANTGTKYLVQEKTWKKAQTAIRHHDFVGAEIVHPMQNVRPAAATPKLPVVLTNESSQFEDLIGWDTPAPALSKNAPIYVPRRQARNPFDD